MDPVNSVVQEQADACTCYDQDECRDECALGTDNCADEATCTNTADSFECTCNDGYTGNGVTCTEQSVVWLSNNGVDVDYRNQDGVWTDARGNLDQIEVGEFGVFGISTNDALVYKVGTHENPYAFETRSLCQPWQSLCTARGITWQT